VGEKGVKLSGGQKQRIVLARAILRKPRILILDEATSSLDAESEKLIGDAMKKILGKQTTFIITHKLATVASADKIVVIGEGRITEIGKHEELISKKGIYNKLSQLQLNI
jgi:ABC-type multidrug transport system fused ATPase/permease subunit